MSTWSEKALEKVARSLQHEIYEEYDPYLQAGFLAVLQRELSPILEAGQRYRDHAAASGDDHDAWDATRKKLEEGVR